MSSSRDGLADLIASVTIDTKSGDVIRVHPDGETPVFEGDQRTADAILNAGYQKTDALAALIDEAESRPGSSMYCKVTTYELRKALGQDVTDWPKRKAV